MSSRMLPDAGEQVVISVPQRESIFAQVTGAGDGWLDLELQASPRTAMSTMERLSLYVEFLNDEGVCRVPGHLERPRNGRALGRGFGEEVAVRFAYKGSIQLLQRSEQISAWASVPLLALPGAGDATPVEASTVKVSGGSMLVQGLRGTRVGDLYEAELGLVPNDDPILGRFKVVDIDERGHAEVEWVVIDEGDRTRIIHFAFDQQRQARLEAA